MAMRCAFVFAILAFLGVTNQWKSWDESITYSQADDIVHYEKISRAAPGFPAETIHLHHAQRLTVHYLTGVLAKVSGLPLSTAYRIAWALLMIALLIACERLLRVFKLDPSLHLACFALFLMNPYTVRYYALAYGMIQDLTFMLGTFVLLVGLFETRIGLLLVGLAIAAVGRQTAVMLFPGMALWIFYGAGWSVRPASVRLGLVAASCSLVMVIYLATAWVGASFSQPSSNLTHLIGIFSWMISDAFSARVLLELGLRALLPFILPLALIVGLSGARAFKSVESAACALLALGVTAQPILAGPIMTGRNASRLSALGFAFVLAMLALALAPLRAAQGRVVLAIVTAAAAAASMHHLYSTVGPAGAGTFAALQLAIGAVLLVWGRVARGRSPGCTNPVEFR